MLVPAAAEREAVGLLPAPLAEQPVGGGARALRESLGMEGHAQVRVLLPVPVRGQLGQAAEARLAVEQRELGVLSLGDVARHHLRGGATRVRERCSGHFGAEQGAVHALVVDLRQGNRLLPFVQALDALAHQVARVRRGQLEHVVAEELPRTIGAEQLQHRRVDQDDAPVRMHEDGVGRDLDQLPVAMLGALEGGLHLALALGEPEHARDGIGGKAALVQDLECALLQRLFVKAWALFRRDDDDRAARGGAHGLERGEPPAVRHVQVEKDEVDLGAVDDGQRRGQAAGARNHGRPERRPLDRRLRDHRVRRVVLDQQDAHRRRVAGHRFQGLVGRHLWNTYPRDTRRIRMVSRSAQLQRVPQHAGRSDCVSAGGRTRAIYR